jgi:hypothetical protein
MSANLLFSLNTSFFFLRFFLFSFFCGSIIFYNKNKLHLFFKLLLFILTIFSLDALFQYFFGYNILGYKQIVENRLGGLFNTKLVVGSYLSKLYPILLSVYFFCYDKIAKNNRGNYDAGYDELKKQNGGNTPSKDQVTGLMAAYGRLAGSKASSEKDKPDKSVYSSKATSFNDTYNISQSNTYQTGEVTMFGDAISSVWKNGFDFMSQLGNIGNEIFQQLKLENEKHHKTKQKNKTKLSEMKSSIQQLQEDMKILFEKTAELQEENKLLKQEKECLSFTQANKIGQSLMDREDVLNCM